VFQIALFVIANQLHDTGPQPGRRIQTFGSAGLQIRHPLGSSSQIHLPGMRHADDPRQIHGREHRIALTQLIEFQLHVLRQQFADKSGGSRCSGADGFLDVEQAIFLIIALAYAESSALKAILAAAPTLSSGKKSAKH
jgi:hypothetical protein